VFGSNTIFFFVLLIFSSFFAANALAEGFDLNLSIEVNETFYFEDAIEYKFVVRNLDYYSSIDYINFTLGYWIQNSENILSEYPKQTKSSLKQQKTLSFQYTPSVPENLTICGNITFSSANDTGFSNDFACKNIYVNYNGTNIAKSPGLPKESSLEIESIWDKNIEFGDIVNTKLKLYKGKNTKDVVYVYVEGKDRISDTTRIYLYDNYKNYSLLVPVQLYANCNEEFEDGYYDVIVEGLDEYTSEEIKVDGRASGICEKIYVNKTVIEKKIVQNKTTEKIFINPLDEIPEGKIILSEVKNPIIIYESSSYKTKKLIPIFLVFVLTLIAVLLIWKR